MKGLWIGSCLLACRLMAGGLTFENPVEEVTVPLNESQVTVDFPFTNKSGESATISEYKAGCSCMSTEIKDGKMTYAPGESGVIRGVFDMANFTGTVEKGLQVWLEGDPPQAPSVELKARIHIPTLVEVEPKTTRWEVGDPGDEKVITITMNHVEPIRVTKVDCANPHFSLELETVKEGEVYQLKVKPESTERQHIGLIGIETDCKFARQASQRAYLIIRRPLVAPASTPP